MPAQTSASTARNARPGPGTGCRWERRPRVVSAAGGPADRGVLGRAPRSGTCHPYKPATSRNTHVTRFLMNTSLSCPPPTSDRPLGGMCGCSALLWVPRLLPDLGELSRAGSSRIRSANKLKLHEPPSGGAGGRPNLSIEKASAGTPASARTTRRAKGGHYCRSRRVLGVNVSLIAAAVAL